MKEEEKSAKKLGEGCQQTQSWHANAASFPPNCLLLTERQQRPCRSDSADRMYSLVYTNKYQWHFAVFYFASDAFPNVIEIEEHIFFMRLIDTKQIRNVNLILNHILKKIWFGNSLCSHVKENSVHVGYVQLMRVLESIRIINVLCMLLLLSNWIGLGNSNIAQSA